MVGSDDAWIFVTEINVTENINTVSNEVSSNLLVLLFLIVKFMDNQIIYVHS